MSKRWALALCGVVCLLAQADGQNPPADSPTAGLPRRAAVDAYILGPTRLVAGSSASFRVAVHWASAPGRHGPLPGARVSLHLTTGRRRVALARARTGPDGNARFRFQVPRVKTGEHELKIEVASRLGSATRRHKIDIFPGGRLLITTDKKLYQPSQVIHIRALALRSIDLKPVERRPIVFQVKDPKGNIVFSKNDRTSAFGVASLDFQLADEINLGRYAVRAWTEGAAGVSSTRWVEVKRYVLPKFKVTVETERAFYRPGETLRGVVRARYFFGKPVAGGRVTLDVRSRLAGVTRYHLPARVTDRQGGARFELRLASFGASDLGRSAPARGGASPLPSARGMGEVRALATVVDSAKHREQGDASVPFTAAPLRLSLQTENVKLVPGVPNRVHVVAGYPDGKPARRAEVRLSSGAVKLRARTDALGVATFTLPAGARLERCGSRDVELTAEARDSQGQRGAQTLCALVASRRAVLVRPDRSMVAPGEPVGMTLWARPSPRPEENRLYLDVVKAGQTLATESARLRRGRARVRFVPDAALFGLLELRAYRLKRSGERVGLSRMVYVDHPGRLEIKVTADRKTYRPGERARLTFRATDSRTGDGVQAALGLVGVDEAVVAMGGLEPAGEPKVFFTLASLAAGRGGAAVSPGGRDLEGWVASEGERRQRTRAADVLLAAIRPVEAEVWETNPWRERRERWDKQAPRLIRKALAFMERSSVGRRTRKGWRFRADLVPRMARAGVIEKTAELDPWKRTVRPWHLRKTDPSFVFDRHARRLAPEKLEAIYTALAKVWKELKLRRERVRKLPRKKWPLILPRDLLARLVKMGRLKPWQIVDPWGRRYRVAFNPLLFVDPYYTGLVSRFLVHSSGPDGVTGTRDDVRPTGPRVRVRNGNLRGDAAVALGNLVGDAIGAAGLGLVGTGRGGGGTGEGTIGLGTLGTIGHGSGSGSGVGLQARVRSRFPETLLWHPELVTDRSGRATLDVELADSITDWRVVATGSTRDGLLGTATTTLRVFQDFFVDIDLPAAMTQGDRVSVPVSVYNYLKTPQRVTLRLERGGWFSPVGALSQTIELGPSQVGVRHFPIVVRDVGRHDLTVRAGAPGGVADAVRRSTLVEPDGVERALSHGGGLAPGEAAHELLIPEQTIDGTARVRLAMYGGPLGQTLDGLEGMLRRPYGCFEQTSSTTYPNVLVLDYLRRTGKATPAVERKARKLINEGYQKLISFEVPGGGFSWFGRRPANRVLTAYGLMEFHDMSRVHPVDRKLIKRTQWWLASCQRKDGSFHPDAHAINEGATNHFREDVLRVTAYIAHALRHTGYRGEALGRALRYVRRNMGKARDGYTLALLGNLFSDSLRAGGRGEAPPRAGAERPNTLRAVLARLWEQRRSNGRGIYFEGPRSTLTYGAGDSGRIETTALAALALLPSRHAPPSSDRLVDTLLAGKDSFGSWHSTQATILALRALLKQHELSRSTPEGEVQVLVDGRVRRKIRLRGERDARHQVDLTPFASRGRHRVALRYSGKGRLQYHLAGSYWVPRAGAGSGARRGRLAIRTRYDRHEARVGQKVRLDVEVRNAGSGQVDMPLVSLSLPPGFAVSEDSLTRLTKSGRVDKVQRVGGRALLYLTRLAAGGKLRFGLELRARYPLRVQARPSSVYEYYRPENRAESRPQILKVL
jgi:hypothetical protein